MTLRTSLKLSMRYSLAKTIIVLFVVDLILPIRTFSAKGNLLDDFVISIEGYHDNNLEIDVWDMKSHFVLTFHGCEDVFGLMCFGMSFFILSKGNQYGEIMRMLDSAKMDQLRGITLVSMIVNDANYFLMRLNND